MRTRSLTLQSRPMTGTQGVRRGGARDTGSSEGWLSLVLQRNAVNALISYKSGPQGWDGGARGVGDRVQGIGLPSPHKRTDRLAYVSLEQDNDIIK